MHILHVAASLEPQSAAGRLCSALRNTSCSVTTLACEPLGFEDNLYFSHSSRQNLWLRRLGRLPMLLHVTRNKAMPWSSPMCGYSLEKFVNRIKPDLVHLHWVAASTIDLSKLCYLKVPVVWTFHDVWPLTAGCHCNMDCEKWSYNCSSCPQLGLGFGTVDVAQFFWNYKAKSYANAARLHPIAPSRWMANMVQQSPLWRNKKVRHIGNALDTSLFATMDKAKARKTWGLPQSVPIVLFGATSTAIPYKGFDLLIEVLGLLYGQGLTLHLAVFGEHSSALELPFPTTFVGYVYDPHALTMLYAAVDVFVSPSKQDTLPTTVLEASACQRPCVAFDIGGVSDIVLHGKSGYLAQPFDTAEMAHAIRVLLEQPDMANFWGQRAREHILSHFDSSLIAQQHLEAYHDILQESHP